MIKMLLKCCVLSVVLVQNIFAATSYQSFMRNIHEDSWQLEADKPGIKTRLVQYFIPYFRAKVSDQLRKLNSYKKKTEKFGLIHQEYLDETVPYNTIQSYYAALSYDIALQDLIEMKTFQKLSHLAKSSGSLFLESGQKYLGSESTFIGTRNYNGHTIFAENSKLFFHSNPDGFVPQSWENETKSTQFGSWRDKEIHGQWSHILNSSLNEVSFNSKLGDPEENPYTLKSAAGSGGRVVSSNLDKNLGVGQFLQIRFLGSDLEVASIERYLDLVIEDLDFSRASELQLLAETYDVFENHLRMVYQVLADVHQEKWSGLKQDYFHKVEHFLNEATSQELVEDIRNASIDMKFPPIAVRRNQIIQELGDFSRKVSE